MNRRDIGRFFFCTIAMLVAAIALPASAHKGAMGIVKERMDGMTAMKNSMAVIGPMALGKQALDRERAIEAAKTISLHAREMKNLFPDTKASRQKVSKSAARVWTDKAEFDGLADGLSVQLAKLQTVLETGDGEMIKARFISVGKACSACHEGFRKR